MRKFPNIEGKGKSTGVLNHIHSTIKWARALRYKQMVWLGKYESKVHNIDSGNPSFEDRKVNDIVIMGLDVKSNYSKYGLVGEIVNNTSTLIKAKGRIFKYPLYELVPVLREKLS